MILADLENYLVQTIGHTTEDLEVNGQHFLVIRNLQIPSGSHAGLNCDIAVPRTDTNPWIPPSQIHVRPHLTSMGQNSSRASSIGSEWQYLSRRFDEPPNPKKYYARILSILAEL